MLGVRGLRVPLLPPPSPALLAWVAFPGPFAFFCLPCLLFSFRDFTSARVHVRVFLRFCVPCSAGACDGMPLMGNTLLPRFAHTGSMVGRFLFGVAGPSTTSVDSGLSRWLRHAGSFLSHALKAGSRGAGFFILLLQCSWCIFHVSTRGILLWKLLSFRLQVIFRLQVFGKLAPCL